MAKDNQQRKKLFRSNNEPIHQKVYMYLIVVNYGYSDPVLELLRNYGSNVQYVCLGRGTAAAKTWRILGIENNEKEIISAFVSEENINDIKNELTKYFAIHTKLMGFAFSIQLSSLVGEKMYHFLTNFIKE